MPIAHVVAIWLLTSGNIFRSLALWPFVSSKIMHPQCDFNQSANHFILTYAFVPQYSSGTLTAWLQPIRLFLHRVSWVLFTGAIFNVRRNVRTEPWVFINRYLRSASNRLGYYLHLQLSVQMMPTCTLQSTWSMVYIEPAWQLISSILIHIIL